MAGARWKLPEMEAPTILRRRGPSRLGFPSWSIDDIVLIFEISWHLVFCDNILPLFGIPNTREMGRYRSSVEKGGDLPSSPPNRAHLTLTIITR